MLTFRSLASSSTGNLNLLSDGETTIMLDCGLPWRKACEIVGHDRIGSIPILITHEHRDHCKGILDKQCRNDIYMLHATKTALNLTGYNHKIIEHAKTYTAGTLRFVPFQLVHDVPCVGYLIVGQDGERAAYITDTAYVPNKLPPLSLLAVECNYCEEVFERNLREGLIDTNRAQRIKMTHFGMENVIEFLNANDLSKLREIHLLHLSDDNSDELRMLVNVEIAAPNAKVFVANATSFSHNP